MNPDATEDALAGEYAGLIDVMSSRTLWRLECGCGVILEGGSPAGLALQAFKAGWRRGTFAEPGPWCGKCAPAVYERSAIRVRDGGVR